MKKVLIFHTAFIGDIVLSTSLIKKLYKAYDNPDITYVTTPAGASLLKNNPYLYKIISYDKRGKDKGLKAIFSLGTKLKKEKFDIAIIPHRYLRSSFIGWLSGAKLIIGYEIAAGSFFLNKKVSYNKDQHEVERLLSLVDSDKEIDDKLELYPGRKEISKIDAIWEKYNLYDYKKIVIAPGSKWFTKMWPIDYFNLLLKELNEFKNLKIILIGGNDELKLPIMEGSNVINMIGKTSLLELAELIKRSDLIVTNDSSPIHIASAFDTFIIAIFGATVKELGFFPWSKNSVVIENNNLNCRPCGLHGGKSCPVGHFKCMKDIKPELVMDEIRKRLKL